MGSDNKLSKLNRFSGNARSGAFLQIEGRDNLGDPFPKDFTVGNRKYEIQICIVNGDKKGVNISG